MKIQCLCLFGTMLLLQGCPVSPFSRTREFEAKAREGQPLVVAIEAFRKDTGNYPATLAELVPKYLPNVPKQVTGSKHYPGYWEYFTITNDRAVSYDLSFFMGKGGVQFTGSNWMSNDDGHYAVLSVSP